MAPSRVARLFSSLPGPSAMSVVGVCVACVCAAALGTIAIHADSASWTSRVAAAVDKPFPQELAATSSSSVTSTSSSSGPAPTMEPAHVTNIRILPKGAASPTDLRFDKKMWDKVHAMEKEVRTRIVELSPLGSSTRPRLLRLSVPLRSCHLLMSWICLQVVGLQQRLLRRAKTHYSAPRGARGFRGFRGARGPTVVGKPGYPGAPGESIQGPERASCHRPSVFAGSMPKKKAASFSVAVCNWSYSHIYAPVAAPHSAARKTGTKGCIRNRHCGFARMAGHCRSGSSSLNQSRSVLFPKQMSVLFPK